LARLTEISADIPNTQFVVYVSTAAVHSPEIAAALPTYSLSKKAGLLLIQKLSDEVDPNEMQIVSFHPGTILSETSRNAGLTEDSLPFDDSKSRYFRNPLSQGVIVSH
jgi:NAD(P)-dependent dehydrogenase (short-subunit alcohol dehydrogenase family)